MDEGLGRVTGWNDLWEALVEFGDRLCSDEGLQYLPPTTPTVREAPPIAE